jgi:type 1 glutamine amidotransferase
VAVVTGGHDFEEKEFFQMFDSLKGIEYTRKHQADDSELFEDINNWPYDVIVLYNMTQKISAQRQQNFLKLLDKGIGVVAVHHSIAAFQNWPEYRKIIGGKYFLSEGVENGVPHKRGGYKEGLNFTIHIEDSNGPITRGMSDFVVNDETYRYYFVDPPSRALLTTDEQTSEKVIGWVSGYKRARVCYIQPGHGAPTYANESYRKLVSQAIRWSAGRQ